MSAHKELDRKLSYALGLLDNSPIGVGGHPASRIEDVARKAGVRVEQVRAALHDRGGR